MDKAQVYIIRNKNKTLTLYYRIKTEYNLELKYFQHIEEMASRVENKYYLTYPTVQITSQWWMNF